MENISKLRSSVVIKEAQSDTDKWRLEFNAKQQVFHSELTTETVNTNARATGWVVITKSDTLEKVNKFLDWYQKYRANKRTPVSSSQAKALFMDFK